METEKIDVPKFEGFECAGILIPKEHNDVYILNGMVALILKFINGLTLISFFLRS